MKILIVDDEPHILRDLGDALRAENHEVHAVAAIDDAINIISSMTLDVAVIDLKLDFTTGYSGIEVYKYIQSHSPNTKVIILSGYNFDHFVQQYSDQLGSIISDIKPIYVYKGGRKNYIEAVLDKIGLESKSTAWYGVYHALLIAVQNYSDKNLRSLNYPISDIQRFRDVLTKYYAFDENHVEFLVNPTRETILEKLHHLSTKLSPLDNLLIFFAGHGSWDDKRSQGYWLAHDAKKLIPANWLSNNDIRDFIRAINTKHTLLISDACFSGAIFKGRSDVIVPLNIYEKYEKRSRRAIASGDATQTVPDRSIFVEYLLRRLRDNSSEYLYAEKLFVEVLESFIRDNRSSQNPVYGVIEGLDDEVGGDFIFVKR